MEQVLVRASVRASVREFDRHNLVPGLDRIDHLKPLDHLAEAGVVPVEVCGVLSAVADEELRSAGVAARVGHREHATIVALISTVELAFDLVPRTTAASAVRAPALDDEVRNHAVKREPVVVTLAGEVTEVLHGVWSIGVEELDDHVTLRSFDGGFRHRAQRIRDSPTVWRRLSCTIRLVSARSAETFVDLGHQLLADLRELPRLHHLRIAKESVPMRVQEVVDPSLFTIEESALDVVAPQKIES